MIDGLDFNFLERLDLLHKVWLSFSIMWTLDG